MAHPRAEQIRKEAKPNPVYPQQVKGMTWCTSNRAFTLNTRTGHCVRYARDVPKLTPNIILEDAMAVGIMPTDDHDVPGGEDEDNGPLPQEATGSARIAAIRLVCEALKERNGRNDFNAAGQPNIHIINKSLGYTVDITEMQKVWRQMELEAANDLLADPDEAIDDAGPTKPDDADELASAISDAVALVMRTGTEDHLTAHGIPTVRAVENVLGYDITEQERDAAVAVAAAGTEAVTMQEKPAEEPAAEATAEPAAEAVVPVKTTKKVAKKVAKK